MLNNDIEQLLKKPLVQACCRTACQLARANDDPTLQAVHGCVVVLLYI